jgi:diguanylate cyclase (GGDEF)-like protein
MSYEIPLKRIRLHYTGKYVSFNPLFWLDYSQKMLGFFRVGVLLPVLLVCLSTLIQFPEMQNEEIRSALVMLRFRFLIPLLLIAFALSFLPRFRKIMLQTQISAGIVCAVYLITAEIMLQVNQPYLYFTLLLLVIIGVASIIRIRFVGSLILYTVIFILYSIAAIFLEKTIPLSTSIMRIFLLALISLGAGCICHYQEKTSRRIFILNHLFENESQKTQLAQIELERMTMRHTSEMISTSKQLYSKYSELLNSERKLQEAMAHDNLTNLPHRFIFMDRLKHATEISKLNQTSFAIMIINIDHFRSINDAFGIEFGDKVLQQLSERLKSSIHEGNTIARLGGDEFGIIIEDLKNETDAHFAAEKILSVIKQAINVHQQTVFVTACIGFALYPFDGEGDDTLFKNAMTALEKAKMGAINSFQRFRESMDNHSFERMTLSNQLRSALDDGEYFLEYQPQYHAVSRQIIGLEALIRWNHPKLGVIPPSHFIPMAEEIGIISSIGEWVLRTACKQMKAWEDAGYQQIPIAVNVSGVQLKQKKFVEQVRLILEETGLNPAMLELELTENIVFQNIDNNLNLLKQLRELGVRLAIDDFGAGYSTLSHLARLPINTIKIDQLFATNIMKNQQDAAIVSGIIAIAEKLKLNLIAEGIETYEQLHYYIQQGCFHIQGWYFSTSLSPDQTRLLLNKNNIAKTSEPGNEQSMLTAPIIFPKEN